MVDIKEIYAKAVQEGKISEPLMSYVTTEIQYFTAQRQLQAMKYALKIMGVYGPCHECMSNQYLQLVVYRSIRMHLCENCKIMILKMKG